MNCKEVKDEGCNTCPNKMLCRTYLELKPLDEYDDTEPVGYGSIVEWNNDIAIIATARRNPILGVEIETNVIWSTIPQKIREKITIWANKQDNNLKKEVDWKGITKTFEF